MGRRLRLCGCLVLVATSACQFDETVVPPVSRRMVVHSVLDPDAQSIRVLLEQIRGGEGNSYGGTIEASGGIPISNARVVIRGPGGDSAIGVEDLAGTGGKGVYFFTNGVPGSEHDIPIVRGATYELSVTAQGNPPLRATTVVPNAVETLPDSFVRFNRERDTIHLSWPAATGAARYVVWIDNEGFLSRITVSTTSISLLANRRTEFFDDYDDYRFDLGRRQRVMVTAVDANYFDYFRSETNPLTGTGLINHVEGGIGLFGALVDIRELRVWTVAPQDEPVEGLFERTDSDPSPAPRWIDLYVDAKGSTGNLFLEGASGNDSSVTVGHVYGSYIPSLGDTDVNLTVSEGVGNFTGKLFGSDSIVGTLEAYDRPPSGRLVYRKRRTIP